MKKDSSESPFDADQDKVSLVGVFYFFYWKKYFFFHSFNHIGDNKINNEIQQNKYEINVIENDINDRTICITIVIGNIGAINNKNQTKSISVCFIL